MQEQHVYEYAVIRVVPRPERGEFLNVGVVLYCRGQAFLQGKFSPDDTRLALLCPDMAIDDVRCHLEAFEQICLGSPHAGPIAALDKPSRFRWLTARRSTVVQASEVHPGLCTDAPATLERLYDQMVRV